MIILLAGDSHGSLSFANWLIQKAQNEGASVILVLGDFGYIWNDPSVLQRLDRKLEKAGIKLWWIDGNHENFHLMESMGIRPTDVSATDVTGNIRYLPRGYRFEIGGIDFMTFGGAVSVDRPDRFPGRSWWHEEAITVQQADSVPEGAEVDILLSHDAPDGVLALDEFLARSAHIWQEGPLRDSDWNRKLLGEVVDKVKPGLVVHGHYHHRYTGWRENVRVEGLNCNEKPDEAYLILNTEILSG